MAGRRQEALRHPPPTHPPPFTQANCPRFLLPRPLAGLEELSLAGNRLTALPAEVGQLSYLARLQLAGNQLAALPPGVCELSALQGGPSVHARRAPCPAKQGALECAVCLLAVPCCRLPLHSHVCLRIHPPSSRFPPSARPCLHASSPAATIAGQAADTLVHPPLRRSPCCFRCCCRCRRPLAARQLAGQPARGAWQAIGADAAVPEREPAHHAARQPGGPAGGGTRGRVQGGGCMPSLHSPTICWPQRDGPPLLLVV